MRDSLKFVLVTFITLLIGGGLYSAFNEEEQLPDDIRYMLEDMYGADKKKWPASKFKKDLNHDSFFDWVVQKKSCLSKSDCPAELFICIPNIEGVCSEYCYMEIKSMNKLQEEIKSLKCESTC